MNTHQKYDAIIIGSGQSGSPLSTLLAQKGKKVALIEREHVAGTCINEGCTPTKTMIFSGIVANLTRRAADYGVTTSQPEIDMVKVRQRKRDIVDSFREGSLKRIENADGLDLLMGEASFVDAHTVNVAMNNGSQQQVRADLIFINTGCRPGDPPFPGGDQIRTYNSTTIMDLDRVPKHLIIFGGSYIAVEFAQLFRRFGSEVTIIERGEHLLKKEDEDVSQGVEEIFQQDGINLRFQTTIQGARGSADGGIELTVQTPQGEQKLTGTHLLVAAGRIPNTDRLNTEVANLKINERGYLQVNDRLETNVPGIYGLGDVTGSPQFTHISYDHFRIIRTNLLEDGQASTNGRMLPYTVFIDPQLGRIGLSEKEARAQGQKYKVAKMPMNYVARALEVDQSRGFMKVLVDPESGQLVGAAVLGLEGGEIMAMFEIAMLGKLHYSVLENAIFAHPTLAESLNNLFANLQ